MISSLISFSPSAKAQTKQQDLSWETLNWFWLPSPVWPVQWRHNQVGFLPMPFPDASFDLQVWEPPPQLSQNYPGGKVSCLQCNVHSQHDREVVQKTRLFHQRVNMTISFSAKKSKWTLRILILRLWRICSSKKSRWINKVGGILDFTSNFSDICMLARLTTWTQG